MTVLSTTGLVLSDIEPESVTEQMLGDDEALMEAFRDADDAQAIGELFDRYASRVDALVFRLTADPALARDITQTTFLSVVRGKGRYVDGCAFRPWLFTIAMNALRDQFRRRRREVLMPDDATTFNKVAHSDQHRDLGLSERLMTALHHLPLEQREAVVLHQLEELSFSEVADIVGCSRTAAKVRAHRGYQRLRELLADLGEEFFR